ncbi:MAG: hypothetical protein U0939_12185 [Pirellulales bacterium]
MPKVQGTLKKAGSSWQVTVPTRKGSASLPIPLPAQCFAQTTAEGTTVEVETDAANKILKVTVPGQPAVRPPAPTPSKSGPKGKGGGGGGPGRFPQSSAPRPSASRPSASRPSASRPSASRPAQAGGGYQGGTGGGGPKRAKRRLPKAPPSVIGLPFHNPYTFVPFTEERLPLNELRKPTWLTADEFPVGAGKPARYTGVLELSVKTLSPLMTCQSRPYAGDDTKKKGHKKYRALTIGPDVIVPATGVRGALRNLMTILAGGALTHVNRHAHLVQGRDLNLGPRSPKSPPGTPKHVFLAEVVRPGTMYRSGVIRVGQTVLVKLEDLKGLCHPEELANHRGAKGQPLWAKIESIGANQEGELRGLSQAKADGFPWQFKLSGPFPPPKNNRQWVKREGALKVDPSPKGLIEVPSELWEDYCGRNAHGDRTELKRGDLVWLEPVNPDQPANSIRSASEIRSLQWARWGRRGQPVMSRMPEHVHPNYLDEKGRVDMATDLFGQVSRERGKQTSSFAGRIRPENLVFLDAAAKVQRDVVLAPLAQPHPGCIAFYRDNTSPDDISEADMLRGYKVYRTTNERGEKSPWRYQVQGVYGERNKGDARLRQPPQQDTNKTSDLVPERLEGQLRIAFRALTAPELALLLQACHVPWRLGGGKPLCLGHCSVEVCGLIDEEGQPLQVADWSVTTADGKCVIAGWEKELDAELRSRAAFWTATQQPVENVRYPRAVDENNNGKTRGGHVWNQRHAKPRMITQDDRGVASREPGLEPLDVAGPLREAAEKSGIPLDPVTPLIAGQVLPPFQVENPSADLLYGYDAFGGPSTGGQTRVLERLEPFDEQRHITGRESSAGNQGKNAAFRQQQRADRRDEQG